MPEVSIEAAPLGVARSSTLARVAAMRRLISMLVGGPCTRAAICAHLRVSDSCGRKYLNALMAAALVERHEPGSSAQSHAELPVYALAASAGKARRFLLEIAGTPAVFPVRCAHELIMPGRRFHYLRDDAPPPINTRIAPILPDPWALPTAFFARAGSGARA
jgi:hypothetical protein